MTALVFGYGALLDHRDPPTGFGVGRAAYLDGFTLEFRNGYATIRREDGGRVHGVLLEVRDDRHFDRMEGFRSPGHPENLYERYQVVATLLGGSWEVEAWVYEMNRWPNEQKIVWLDYLERIREGYQFYGLPEAALDAALAGFTIPEEVTA